MQNSCLLFAVLLIGACCYVQAVDTDAAFFVYNNNQTVAGVPGGPLNYTLIQAGPFVYANVTEAQNAIALLTSTADVTIPDVCATNNPCGTNGNCTNFGPSVAKCSCPSGFQQNQSTATYAPNPSVTPDGTNCPDIDECTPVNATLCGAQTVNCSNTVGSYVCTCSANYYFNSATMLCEDVDECNNSSLNNCSSTGSVCTNTPGSFSCACASGFTGDGVTCTDIIDCGNGTTCGPQTASCTDIPGSYQCTCNAAYVFNNATLVCEDEDECLTGTHNCHTDATCGNTVGSFTCICNTGYSGNGTSCSDVDECIAPNPCDTNANCTNTVGSFTCTCNTGYTGNGTSCIVSNNNFCYRAVFSVTGAVSTSGTAVADAITIINEITSFTHSAVNATVDLVNTATSEFIISYCFTGASNTADELTALLVAHNTTSTLNSLAVTSINDYDECANGYGNCSAVSTCTNQNGTYDCVCPPNLYDQSPAGFTGVTCNEPVTVNCIGSRVEVTAVEAYFVSKGVANASNLFFGDCNATVTGGNWIYNGTCSPALSDNGTHILSSWNLTTIHPSVSFYTGAQPFFPITCLLNKNTNITSGGINVSQSVITGNNNAVSGSLDLTVVLSLDAGGLVPLPSTVGTTQKIYATVSPKETIASGLFVYITTVYTYGKGNPSQTMQLITSGCPTTSTSTPSALLSTLETISNGVSGTAQIGFQAHFFSSNPETIVHVEATLCQAGSCGTPPSSCKRRKRSVVIARMRRATAGESGTGEAIITRASNDTCTKDCAEGVCFVENQLAQTCLCPTTTYKTAKGKCLVIGVTEEVEQDTKTIWILVGLAILVVVLAAIALGVFFVRRSRSGGKN